MRIAFTGGLVVTGDGATEIPNGALILNGDRIEGIESRWDIESFSEAEVIDVTGCVVVPGLINCHTHGVTPGPLFPSAESPLAEKRWRLNLDRNLLGGTTTVLSLCGFVSMQQVRDADESHPVNVKAATAHMPHALRAAHHSDGSGLTPDAGEVTVESMLAEGAVAIGEMGAGTTLGGGGQDVVHIPNVIEHATGIRIDSHQARAIKEAALSRFIQPGYYDRAAMKEALAAAGLTAALSPDAARGLVDGSVMPSVEDSRASFHEAAALSAELGVPALLHNAAATIDEMRSVSVEHEHSGAQLVACHCNHSTFRPDEALALAVELAGRGVAIELSVVDLVRRRKLVRSRENWDVLLAEPGLVDVLATDYGFHGDHDSLMESVEDVVRSGHATLPAAVAMATSRVAELIPGIAPERGQLKPGWIADLAIVNADNFTDVRDVFVGGQHVVSGGAIVAGGR